MIFIIIIIKILYQILLQQAAQPSHRNIWKVGYNKTCTLSTLFGYISGYKTGYIHFYSKNIKNDKDLKELILIPNTLQLELLFISQHGEIAYHDFTGNSYGFSSSLSSKYSTRSCYNKQHNHHIAIYEKLGTIKHVP